MVTEDQSNISILIIEDEAVVAHDIARRIKKLGYDVADIKHESQKAINYLSIHSPDLILCDINIDGDKDGVEVAEFVFQNKKTPLIFVTALSDRATLERAKKVLPYGYIVKPFDTHDLLTAIELALYKHSQEIERLSLTPNKVEKITSDPLSEREFEMLIDISKGMTNAQISESRHISLSTTKFHIGNLLRKMDATNRADALHKIITLLTN